MGKVFKNQTKLTLRLDVGTDLTGVGAECKIKYLKPSKEQGEFIATIETNEITYDVQAGDLDQYGNWIFWSYVLFPNGEVAQGEAEKLRVYKEGEIK